MQAPAPGMDLLDLAVLMADALGFLVSVELEQNPNGIARHASRASFAPGYSRPALLRTPCDPPAHEIANRAKRCSPE